MQKIVINVCYGGFGLSKKAFDYVNIDGNIESEYEIQRDDKRLVAFIENNSTEVASSEYSELKIVEIPDGVDWVICDYDGVEWVAEKHRTWE